MDKHMLNNELVGIEYDPTVGDDRMRKRSRVRLNRSFGCTTTAPQRTTAPQKRARAQGPTPSPTSGPVGHHQLYINVGTNPPLSLRNSGDAKTTRLTFETALHCRAESEFETAGHSVVYGSAEPTRDAWLIGW